ncbi:family 20 glycosylhydrolase [Capnocytophaga sp. oral taxon 323]|uniref:glycoside hydrolase family 20 protein n=1 Tax=Capnocytophaga sp. oral taxon 323 TaxID=1705617 RepID=UPI0006ADD468|nr:family 20 glycosylhydrolase [Capnocytophaga sp. oral taxon 323]ALC98011.1 beta-N-acetylhexosaminidase [Capnocytophaga sp. oral taxon 323]
MKKLIFSLVTLCFMACKGTEPVIHYEVIPLPQSISYTHQKPFELDAQTVITYPQGDALLQRNAQFLASYLKEITGLTLATEPNVNSGKVIRLKTDLKKPNQEAYQLTVASEQITIDGASPAGVFYGIQTLRKSIDVTEPKSLAFPTAVIDDAPRFAYRGMHFDVSRHFFTVDFIKQYIDILALHNLNKFHWHLTDDQGWRIEIKKYPRLTEVGSTRKETLIGHLLKDKPHQFDGKPYGGFYTQEQIKEIVKYAQDRYITIIPEVDIPGHTLAVLTAYPELGCTGKDYAVGTKWGVFDDVLCAGNEASYEFLEGVFDEITELFPSKYIHIGGDECPKTRWKDCPKCQAKIKALGLKGDAEHTAEQKLQGYVVSRVEQFLKKKNREVIGWDEILEGDNISQEAIVMSWRGTEGGIAAAQRHNRAIMTPHYSLYFDYNQGEDPSKEPLSIGEYLPVKKVYDYEPIDPKLTPEQGKYILGAQANLWTEYIASPAHAQYMLLPRLAALAEVQWTAPEKKNYADFLKRLGNLLNYYQKEGYHYAKHVLGVTSVIQPAPKKDGIQVELLTVGDGKVYYTTDGTTPDATKTLYTQPIKLSNEVLLKAVAVHKDTISGVFSYQSLFNKATYKPIQLLTETNPKYTFGGATALVDAQIGEDSYIDGHWVGFPGRVGVEAVIDLGKEEEISNLKTGSLSDTPNWIFPASEVAIYSSADGKNFQLITQQPLKIAQKTDPIKRVPISLNFAKTKTRYVKVVLKGTVIPEWHEGKGTPALLFVDEIQLM